MKRNTVALSIAVLVVAIATIWLMRRSMPVPAVTPSPQAQAPSTPQTLGPLLSNVTVGKNPVDFEGVSFTYDTSLFSDMTAENIAAAPLENADDKPDYVSPQHVLFTPLGPYASKHESSDFQPEIHLYSLDGFPQAYAISEDSVTRINGEILKLRTLLSHPSTRLAGEIPYLPFIDATQTFRAHVKRVDFQGGKGILFLTQYDSEPSLVNNDGLTYIFEGITGDGLYYVLATFPVSAPGMAESNEVKIHEGYTPPSLPYSPGREKAHKQYLAKVVREIEALAPGKFDPDLRLLEKMVQTIHVDGKSER